LRSIVCLFPGPADPVFPFGDWAENFADRLLGLAGSTCGSCFNDSFDELTDETHALEISVDPVVDRRVVLTLGPATVRCGLVEVEVLASRKRVVILGMRATDALRRSRFQGSSLRRSRAASSSSADDGTII